MLAAATVWPLDQLLWRPVWAGLPALAMCAGLALTQKDGRPGPVGRALGLGGDASYALYLSHPFAITPLAIGWRKLDLGLPWVFIATGIALAVAASIVTYLIVERPIMRWLGRAWAGKPVTSPRAPDGSRALA
jgi:exopolysaccharide production protein ExoZ